MPESTPAPATPGPRPLPVDDRFAVLGNGQLGGKAHGLATLKRVLAAEFPLDNVPNVTVCVPRLTVIATDVFDHFMAQNDLFEIAQSDLPDERIAHAFVKAELPPAIVGDLLNLVTHVTEPLAVRSSSMLEDALAHPFAGTYATKMIPNHQPDADTRFRRLAEAIKFVYASTFFRDAKSYLRAIGKRPEDERMAVIIQEIVGQRINERFYPTISGVLRTYNFYPRPGGQPGDGVVNLALGLGKTIVDGGVTWSYSPARPRSVPPYASLRDLLHNSQTRFWAVNMGTPPYDPVAETEYLVEGDLHDAEVDASLKHVASTYDAESDRLTIGTGSPGPRVLTFAPVLDLEDVPLNPVLERLAQVCRKALDSDVEIEFAVVLDRKTGTPARVGVLQLRPLLVSEAFVEVSAAEQAAPHALLASETVLGNGMYDDLSDIVYVNPDTFDTRHTRDIAVELDTINRTLAAVNRPYVLIGFGRWGSSDPWLGIPVTWPQISAARVIVETTLPDMNVEPSQGTHFFHNMTSFQVLYFTLHHSGPHRIDWDWLRGQAALAEGKFVRHVRVRAPLTVKVDGRCGHGVILHAPTELEHELESGGAVDAILRDLQERAKELSCLYTVEELATNGDIPVDRVFQGVIDALPAGWQYPSICCARIIFDGRAWKSQRFEQTPWVQRAVLRVQGEAVGTIEVFYIEEMPQADEGPFLKEERKLIDIIADRLGNCITHRHLMEAMRDWKAAQQKLEKHKLRDWTVILDLLRRTDQSLLLRVARKMINHLCWAGVKEADVLLRHFGLRGRHDQQDLLMESNQARVVTEVTPDSLVDETFRIAGQHLSDEEIVNCIQKWIKQDRASFLVNALENHYTSLSEVADAIHRYHHATQGEVELSISTRKGLRVSLIRRFLTDQLEYINVAKNYVDINDFHDLTHRMIYPARGHGKIGGKSAGMFLAGQIVKYHRHDGDLFENIRTPKTWFVTSDGLHDFIYCNHLEDVFTQKYKDIDEIRQEYPDIVQIFKHSQFPADIVKGLSMALDDFGEQPLIVRSSSLLEDRFGAAFSGKYKSLFLANQGTKRQRLAKLLDAISEIYASVFSPDPIQYRAERNLLDFQEGMGVMIQEVVGTRIGRYYAPAFAGVAFSLNEFRWSPRIKREDGLLRLVPGLGTRAVDRVGDDYPVLISPGQPGLRVNATVEECVRYAPRSLDMLNLETGQFETVEVEALLREFGDAYPNLEQIVSVCEHGRLRPPLVGQVDFERDDLVVSFEGLLTRTPFIHQMQTLLKLLEDKVQAPVDIEFASDGRWLYLLQCRAQTQTRDAAPAQIPHDLAPERVIFSANRYVSNGRVPTITHIVYVDPQRYTELGSHEELVRVGRAVGRLNKLLPKRRFILMGPGRWGSRGDIKLGVHVTYSDINNTALLVEIARRQGDYTPDLSFGTHFFQDLVESSIRYLPLYPDEPDVLFQERFLLEAPNVLADLAPEYADLADVLHVIDVAHAADGQALHVLMNAEDDQAVALLGPPSAAFTTTDQALPVDITKREQDWRWRLRMAERVAAQLDPAAFGVAGFYVFGSVKNATAGPASDIDVLIHFRGTGEQRTELERWLEGWSLCLSEMNYLRTGYRTDGLLDVHFVTDEDITRRTSYAVRIGAVSDAARALPMKGHTETH